MQILNHRIPVTVCPTSVSSTEIELNRPFLNELFFSWLFSFLWRCHFACFIWKGIFLVFLPVTETICPHEIVTVSMIWNSIQRSINLARASWLSVSGDERKSGRAAKKRASAVSPPPAGVFRASLFYPIFPLSAGYARFPAVWGSLVSSSWRNAGAQNGWRSSLWTGRLEPRK